MPEDNDDRDRQQEQPDQRDHPVVAGLIDHARGNAGESSRGPGDRVDPALETATNLHPNPHGQHRATGDERQIPAVAQSEQDHDQYGRGLVGAIRRRQCRYPEDDHPAEDHPIPAPSIGEPASQWGQSEHPQSVGAHDQTDDAEVRAVVMNVKRRRGHDHHHHHLAGDHGDQGDANQREPERWAQTDNRRRPSAWVCRGQARPGRGEGPPGRGPRRSP